MHDALLTLVESELLPAIAPLGFVVAHSETSDSFGNASVILQAPALRLRVIRERSQIFLDVGPTSEPSTWFDSAVVIDYLGLSANGGFHAEDARRVLRSAGAFVTAMWSELTAKFNGAQLPATKRELQALAEQRAAKMFGG